MISDRWRTPPPTRSVSVASRVNVPSAASPTSRAAFAAPQPAATFTIARPEPSSAIRKPISVSWRLARFTLSGAVPPP